MVTIETGRQWQRLPQDGDGHRAAMATIARGRQWQRWPQRSNGNNCLLTEMATMATEKKRNKKFIQIISYYNVSCIYS